MNRRKFVETIVNVVGGISISQSLLAKEKFEPVRFGIITSLVLVDGAEASFIKSNLNDIVNMPV